MTENQKLPQQFDELAQLLGCMDAQRHADVMAAARVFLSDEFGRESACEMVALGERLSSLAGRNVTHG